MEKDGIGCLMPAARAGTSTSEGRKEETRSSVGPLLQSLWAPSSSDGIDYLRLLSFAVRERGSKLLIEFQLHLNSVTKSGTKADGARRGAVNYDF